MPYALTDTTGQPLAITPGVAQLQRYSTTRLPTNEGSGTDESVSIVGDFNQLIPGLRTSGVVIRVPDAGTETDGSGRTINANTQLMRRMVVYLRADVTVTRPG
jgi:hypothetical protein